MIIYIVVIFEPDEDKPIYAAVVRQENGSSEKASFVVLNIFNLLEQILGIRISTKRIWSGFIVCS